MNNNFSLSDTKHEAAHGTITSYGVGFFASIVLTLAAYFFVESHASSHHEYFSHAFLYIAIAVPGIVQVFIQLFYFLHLGKESKPHWNVGVLLFASLLVAIVAGGSLWIMRNLNYNMTRMSPTEVDHYMLDQ